MNNHFLSIPGLVLVLLSGSLVVGCSPAQIRKDIVIDRVVQEAKIRSRKAMQQNPEVFQSINVRREGDATVVFEYVLKPEAESQVDELARNFTGGNINDQGRNDLQLIADEGISARIIFKNTTGETLDDFVLSGDDL